MNDESRPKAAPETGESESQCTRTLHHNASRADAMPLRHGLVAMYVRDADARATRRGLVTAPSALADQEARRVYESWRAQQADGGAA